MRNLFALIVGLGLLLATALAAAGEPYFEPTKGNQYVTTTDKYLFIVWSVPKNLAPFEGIESKAELEAFIARTAFHLCVAHRSSEPSSSKACKVQVLKLATNDEYSTSAAGYTTIAKLVVPLTTVDKTPFEGVKAMSIEELRALFERLKVAHDRIKP